MKRFEIENRHYAHECYIFVAYEQWEENLSPTIGSGIVYLNSSDRICVVYRKLYRGK